MIGHLIYNYGHMEDAKIQQHIARKLYAKVFDGVHVIHCYNGDKDENSIRYKEDKLIIIKNRGHFQGAADLINAGLEYFTNQSIPDLKYVLVTAADTWVLNTKFLQKIINEMQKNGKVLAASSWGKVKPPEKPAGFSTDFFLFDIQWNRQSKLFPVDYQNFAEKFKDIFALQYHIPTLEVCVQYNYHQYFAKQYQDNAIWWNRDHSFRRIVEREPVHTQAGRKKAWPRLGLYTWPFDKEKLAIAKKYKVDSNAN